MDDFPDIRRARPDDQEQLGALWQAFLEEQATLDSRFAIAEDAMERWNNDYLLWLEDETHRIYAAEPEESIVGLVTAHRWGPPPIYEPSSEVYLDEIYVAPEARREGIGSQLVAAVRHWAESLGADRLRMRTVAANEAARSFWDRQEATPFSTTFTLELDSSDQAEEEDSSIGF